MEKESLKDTQLTWLSLQKVLDEIQASLDEEARQQAGPWSGVDMFPAEIRFLRHGYATPESFAAIQYYLTRAGRESCMRSRQILQEMPRDLFIVC